MNNFRLLDQNEYDKVWDIFNELFDFKPSICLFPAIRTKKPQLKFDISGNYNLNFPYDKLENLALSLFLKITKPGDRIYALDWMHSCYDFDPRQQMDRDEFGEWVVPIFPNGDYYIFLSKDFENTWFGHPWEQTITLAGEALVKHGNELKAAFEKINITIFDKTKLH